MNTTEWTPRIATADRYLDAQYLLMASATGESPIEETLARLDDVRRSRVAFNSLPPAEFQDTRQFTPGEAADAVVFLEKRLQAHKNEGLLSRWLLAAEFPEEISEFERVHGLDIDPDHDIVVIAGSVSEKLRRPLQERRFLRVIDLADVIRDENSNEIDEQKFLRALLKMPEISSVRPNRMHYINNEITDEVREHHLKRFKDRIELFYISRNTNVLMASLWTPNVLKNIPKFISHGHDFLELNKKLLGSTAVVIGAGPSLDESLPKIAAVQDRVVVICAFKALKAMTAFGINPDIVVCLDPKQKIRHLEGVDLNRVGAFAIEVASNDELVSVIDACPLLPFVASPMPGELIKAIGAIDIPYITTGGSAVHGGLQAAILLGCRSIYFAGTDFGFPGNRLYGSGAGTGDQFAVSDDGTTYTRQPLDSHFRGGELFPVPSNSGGVVGASVEMIQFREWTEARIRKAVELDEPCRFFNLCREGAVIAGALFVSDFDSEVLNLAPKPSIRDMVEASSGIARIGAKAVISRYRSRADRLRKLVTSCDTILEKAARDQDWTHDLQKLVKQAGRCLEVSTSINAQLIKLTEYTGRVNVTSSEADSLIIKIVRDAKTAAADLIDVYVAAIAGLRDVPPFAATERQSSRSAIH